MEIREIIYQQTEEDDISQMALSEPTVFLEPQMKFGMHSFEKLNLVLGFSQAEWSEILHFSPRTLQRYLKDGNGFDGLQAELLHHINRLTEHGLTQFSSGKALAQWLRSEKVVLGHHLGFNALKSITGVKMLREELGRIAEGVYI